MATAASSLMLFATPLQVPHVVFGFTSLMLTQLITYQVDLKCVEKEMAPRWFLKFRSLNFSAYMILTSLLFAIFYSRLQLVQRRDHSNRIEHLKEAMDLDDAEFI